MTMRPSVLLLSCLLARFAIASEAPAYSFRYDAASETMAVRICVPHAAAHLDFTGDAGASAFIDGTVRDGGGAIASRGNAWTADAWRAGECLSYRAAVGRAAESRRERRRPAPHAAVIGDPGAWLLRVDDDSTEAKLRVELPAGYGISAPWHPQASSDGALHFVMPRTPDAWMAHVAIGRFVEKPLDVAGGTLRVSIAGDVDAATRAKLEAWIARMSRATVSAYGRLPLADVQVLIVPVPPSTRAPVVFGESLRGQGHGVTLYVDASRSAAELDGDWVVVHEFSHLFHPYLDDRGSWLAEGLATYEQNVLRARAGFLSGIEAWRQLDDGFARGRSAMSANGDTLEGVASASDGRPNFMRIYWSGTAFWLESDLALRKASGDRVGLDDALKRFDACCLPDHRGWTPEDFVAKLDALMQTDVFSRHFATYRARRDFPDLAPTYATLGLEREGDTLIENDAAPDARIRRAIMKAPAH